MKLLAASEALLLLLLEGSFCGSASCAAAVDDTWRDCDVRNQELVIDVFCMLALLYTAVLWQGR